MSEVFTVFFSWQSDTARRHGRDLIREALDIAADAISKDSSIPFRVQVQSDTENEPGLCNIPETIFRRLRESDAVVSDLTFVAVTKATAPKHCSNPNVLFELGYAFAKLGPERLICVMNEVHGPTASQIFDLAHHRRPISFQSPRDGGSRAESVNALAKPLEAALRDVAKLGLTGGYGGDDEILHQRHLSEIQSYWQSTGLRRPETPTVAMWFRPKLFRPNRWPDAETMEALLRTIGPHTDRFSRYPPQPTGNAPMDWGLYNDTYGDPWTLTYAGQFWTEISVGGRQPLTLSERDMRVSPEPPSSNVLSDGEWVMANYSLSQICTVFQLARNLAQQLGASEVVQLGFEATSVRGKWLHFNSWDSMGPCKAPKLRREIEMTSAEFVKECLDRYSAVAKDFCDLFCRDGRVLSREEVKRFCNAAGNM